MATATIVDAARCDHWEMGDGGGGGGGRWEEMGEVGKEVGISDSQCCNDLIVFVTRFSAYMFWYHMIQCIRNLVSHDSVHT